MSVNPSVANKLSERADKSAKPAVLGLDLGTSAVKCVIVVEGRIVADGAASLATESPQAGWNEQSPSAWCAAATQAIQSALTAAGLQRPDIIAIGLSGQMHGAVILGNDGNPLRPAILWNDNRSVKECTALSDACPDIGRIAGVVPLPGFTAPKLMWIRKHEPRLFADISKILLPKDYLAFWLTGEIGTDRSDAAGTLWLDQAARAWSPQVIKASGIDQGWLPELKNGFELAGRLRPAIAATLGLPSGIAVLAGGGDAATGAVALGAVKARRCMMSLGTSGQLLMVDETYKPNPDKLVHAYCHTVPNTWFRMAAMLNGARPLAWFAQVLGVSVEDMLLSTESADMSRIPLFLPYLTGERSPHGDPAIRGSFYGLDNSTGAAEMARAVVEAVAFSMADAMDSFGAEGVLREPIPVIGGGSRSDTLLQVLSDVLEHPVARAAAGQGSAALGAALLAEVGAGLRSESDLAFEPAVRPVFDPRPAPEVLDRLMRYRDLYKALRPFAAKA